MKFSPLTMVLIALVSVLFLSSCSTVESQKVLEAQTVASYNTAYNGEKTTLVVGQFNNRSDYLQGLFSTNIDRLGGQAKTILKTHLQQTNRFKLVDRENMAEIQKEAGLLGQTQVLKGAGYAVTGGVTEFGRKVVGDKQFFGILGSGKKQVAYAKVSLNIVDVITSEIIYSTQGASEYSLTEREVLGFGSNAGYDSTLNGKVLNLSITEAVNNMVRDLASGRLNISPK